MAEHSWPAAYGNVAYSPWHVAYSPWPVGLQPVACGLQPTAYSRWCVAHGLCPEGNSLLYLVHGQTRHGESPIRAHNYIGHNYTGHNYIAHTRSIFSSCTALITGWAACQTSRSPDQTALNPPPTTTTQRSSVFFFCIFGLGWQLDPTADTAAAQQPAAAGARQQRQNPIHAITM